MALEKFIFQKKSFEDLKGSIMIHNLNNLLCLIVISIFTLNQSAANDERQTTVDFIEKFGYPAEEHEVRTDDGYFIKIFRIPYNTNRTKSDRPVILLQHGIVLNSDSWVFRGPGEDLTFLLSDAGYDVWISNSRGTIYSRRENYTNKDAEFWNYGVTETGMYDLRSVVDYILDTTDKRSLTYLGHSRGNAMMVILLAMYPEYNSKINLYIGLAPVIYSKEAKSSFFRLAANGRFSVSNSEAVRRIFKAARVSNLLRMSKGMRQVAGALCNPPSIFTNVCSSLLFLINGDDFAMYNNSITPLFISRFNMGMSAKEYVHLLQLHESDVFRQFDYGKKGNLDVYGQEQPPKFDINKVNVPTYLYYGPNDFFVSERDLFKFAMKLPRLEGVYRIPFPKFNHLDYMWAKVANTLLYPDLISLIGRYNKL